MRRLKSLGLLLATVSTLSAVLAAPAFALPEYLEIIANSGLIGKLDSGKATLENNSGTKFECTEANTNGGLESGTLGTYRVTFEGCEVNLLGLHKCTGVGDATEGVILSEGSLHYVFDTLGGTLGVAILFLPKETEVNCTTLAKSKLKGDVLCLILQTLVGSITHLYHCTPGAAKGSQSEKTYWLDNGSPTTALFLSSLNGGEFSETNLQFLATLVTKLAGEWMNE